MSNDTILNALAQQVECCQRLAKLSQVQREHLRHGRMEQLMNVLTSRQEMLPVLIECEKIVGPARRKWSEFVGELEPGLRTRAETLLAQSQELLRQITESDSDDALVLQQQKLNLGRQIRQTSSAQQVNRMYATAAYGRRPPRMDVQR